MTLKGLTLPAADGSPARDLGVRELRLLEALADGSELPSGEDDDRALVEAVRVRGMLPLDARGTCADAPAEGRAPAEGEQLVAFTPIVFRLGAGGFELLDRDGRIRLRLTAAELLAASEFRHPVTSVQAWASHRARAGGSALDEPAFLSLVRRLVGADFLHRFDAAERGALSREERELRRAVARYRALEGAIDRTMADHAVRERAREIRMRTRRTPVVPVHFQWQIPPLALGMIVAHARAHDGGRLCELYDFQRAWLSDASRPVPVTDRVAVYLFSHYLWTSEPDLAMSAKVKAANPRAVTIHGGPDVPKYEGDVEAWFRAHPHVDVAVRGEGELTATDALAALGETLREGRTDLSVLATVPGLTFRAGDRVVRTPDRGRIAELDALPSPYLTGLFDAFGETATESAVVETNRGCPYGCTFCDWGSATLSRIRRFSLERVFEELEWCARHGVQTIGVADANFGILERDVAIAEKVAELKRRYGAPRHLGLNYAKNSLKHLKPIVKILIGAGVLTYGQLSLQSMDEDTLATIDRSNIKLEKYHELSQEFRRAGLPLFVDLMMGLPGATTTSFRNDLQQSIDREVIAKIHPTLLLMNSPMNEPAYRREHGITTSPGTLVTSAATFTRDDYEEMRQLRRVFLLLEKFGVLRHVARYVRQETGMREVDFLERLWRDARADRGRWPVIAFTLEAVPDLMVPPATWRLFLDEVRRWLVEVAAVADDGALDAVLAVQHALLPARDRRFPETIALAHDYAAWHAAMLAAKDEGHLADWPAAVPRLRELPPGTFTVTDPHQVCVLGIGHSVESDIYGVWELGSPVSRPVTPFHAALD